MGHHRYTKPEMGAWVKAYISKEKSIQSICDEAGICRKTFHNWVKLCDFKKPKSFIKKKDLKKDFNKKSIDYRDKYRMLSSTIQEFFDVVIQRKLVRNIVRRYSITVQDACDIVGVAFTEYQYKAVKPELDDRLVIDVFTKVLSDYPDTPLTDCFKPIKEKYPDCPSKQMKRIRKEYKKAFNNFRLDAKKKNGQRNEKVPKKSDSWVVFIQEFQLSQDVNTAKGKTANKVTIVFLFDTQLKFLLNFKIIKGAITQEDVVGFLLTCKGLNGTPERFFLNRQPLTSSEVIKVKKELKIPLLMLHENDCEGSQIISKIKSMIDNEILLSNEMLFQDYVRYCEDWRSK